MATCPNCGKALSCGCQKKKASDGKIVCATCIGKYELSKKNNTTQPNIIRKS